MPETKNMSLYSLHTLHTHNSITRPAARGHALNAHNAHNERLLNHLDSTSDSSQNPPLDPEPFGEVDEHCEDYEDHSFWCNKSPNSIKRKHFELSDRYEAVTKRLKSSQELLSHAKKETKGLESVLETLEEIKFIGEEAAAVLSLVSNSILEAFGTDLELK